MKQPKVKSPTEFIAAEAILVNDRYVGTFYRVSNGAPDQNAYRVFNRLGETNLFQDLDEVLSWLGAP